MQAFGARRPPDTRGCAIRRRHGGEVKPVGGKAEMMGGADIERRRRRHDSRGAVDAGRGLAHSSDD